MPALDHFGLLAPWYDRFIRPVYPARLAELLGLPCPGRLLDAGGGTGRVARFLATQVDACVIADVSRGMLRVAQASAGSTALCAESEHLPLAGESFERVIMVDALHHVADAAQTASELWRVLRPGGRLVIEEPDIRRLAVKGIALFEKLALMRSHFLRPERMAALFASLGAQPAVHAEGHTVWIVVEK
ncbi:MAG TPA: class I SAM-dependent methyltransferase [Anaerolinea sp.]|nr:class I SAM-dependent methyltransferase [Anaerolinea sp.]